MSARGRLDQLGRRLELPLTNIGTVDEAKEVQKAHRRHNHQVNLDAQTPLRDAVVTRFGCFIPSRKVPRLAPMGLCNKVDLIPINMGRGGPTFLQRRGYPWRVGLARRRRLT